MIFLLFTLYFLLPFERIPTIEVGDFTVKFSYIVALFLLAIFLTNKPFKVFIKKPLQVSDKFLILFWLVGALTLLWAENLQRSMVIVLLWAFMIILYLVLSRIIVSHKHREKIENIIIWSAIITSIFGLYQFIGDSLGLSTTLTGLRYWYTKEIADLGFPRIQSVALEPLYFSSFLLVPLYLAIKKYFLYCHPERSRGISLFSRILHFIQNDVLSNKYFWIITLILTNIILGISRGAYLGLIITLVFFLIFVLLKWKVYKSFKANLWGLGLAILISVFLSYVAVVSFNGQDAAKNFRSHAVVADSEEGNSVKGRMDGYRAAWNLFKGKPILGIGVGNFGSTRTYDNGTGSNFETVNNQYLEILTETGVVGMAVFVFFLIFFTKELYNGYRRANDKEKFGLVLLFLGLMAIFIQYNFFSTLYIIYIWAFLALIKTEGNEGDKTSRTI